LFIACGLAVSLGGCQHFAQFIGLQSSTDARLKVTPVAVNAPAPSPDAAETALYEHAATAIEQRDYGRALDLLQLARDAKENDPRVLTAMGVVYDKLGRFDLSKRYYDLAAAADPGSKVVATDRAYSLVLQHWMATERDPDAMMLAGARVATRLEVATPVVTRLAVATPPLASMGQVSFTGPRAGILGGVQVEDATGRANGVATIRASLSHLGWTLSRTTIDTHTVSAVTEIRYPDDAPDRKRAALGLAHTLRFPVKLAACASCRVVELTIGADAARYTAGPTIEARRG